MKLAPCPFCGCHYVGYSVRHDVLTTGERDTIYRYECLSRDCRAKTGWWFPLGAAAAAWNRRPKRARRSAGKATK